MVQANKPLKDWEVNFKTKQFIATSILLLMTENVQQIGFRMIPEKNVILWMITANNGFKYKREVAIRDIEAVGDSFDNLATRFTASVMSKISGHMKSGVLMPRSN